MNANITPYEREHNVNQRDKQYQIDSIFKTKEKLIKEWPFNVFSTTKQAKYTVDAVFA
jgi:hypothetical protein